MKIEKLEKFMYLTNEQLGIITKCIIEDVKGEEITAKGAMRIYYDEFVKSEVEKMKKHNKNQKEYKKRKELKI